LWNEEDNVRSAVEGLFVGLLFLQIPGLYKPKLGSLRRRSEQFLARWSSHPPPFSFLNNAFKGALFACRAYKKEQGKACDCVEMNEEEKVEEERKKKLLKRIKARKHKGEL